MTHKTRNQLLRHLVDLGAFFENPKVFLDDLRKNDFEHLGYDCSVQLAIRLIRWSRAIDLTPRQTYVMEQILAEAIRRGSNLIERRIRSCSWSIPSGRDRADLAYSTSSKALEHLTETHDFCGGKNGAFIPNPSIMAFVESNTHFVSRESLEHFIYSKRFKAESRNDTSPAPSSFLLETYIRQQKSMLKTKTGERRVKAEQKIQELTARLYGLRSEISLDDLEPSDDNENRPGRLSAVDQLDLAYWDNVDTAEEEIPASQKEFLDHLFQVGDQVMSARDLIPCLIQAREYRAVGGLLRVLRDPNRKNEAEILSDILGQRTLADIRKQLLRHKKSDSGEVVQLFKVCKDYLQWEAGESALVQRAMACGMV